MTKAKSSSEDRQGIQVIARAASILRALEADSTGLSLGELATRLDLARSTVQRIVSALMEEGFVISAGQRAGVTLGPAFIRLAAATVIDTERLTYPILQNLSASIAETVDLSVLRKDRVVFVDQVTGKSRLVAISAVGEAFPLHCTANGKAILSLLSEERRDRLLQGRLHRHTPKTLTNRSELIAEIAEAKRTEVAWDLEEHSLGICAAGTAFIDSVGRYFAISVPVPAGRFPGKREDLARSLLRARAEVLKLFPLPERAE